MDIEEDLLNLIDKKVKPKILWIILFNIYVWITYSTPQFCKRMTCHIKGCNRHGGSGGFNLPIEAYYYECKRCGAVESNYEGDTPYGFIYKGERFWER